MGLLDDLKQPPPRVWGCRIREIAESLAADDAKIFLDAVNNPQWSIIGLSQALRAKGIRVSESPIKAHRVQACTCYQKTK